MLKKNKCTSGTEYAILKSVIYMSLVQAFVIYQMKGLFKLNNNGVTLWY